MHLIPIKFEHNLETYAGHFQLVSGAGSNQVWHLMVDSYYFGRLRLTDEWIFDSRTMYDMSAFFGDYMVAWHQ